MAHEIEVIGDKASMAYTGETPWHGLGNKVPSDVSPSQMLEAANLDWSVLRKELYFESDEGPVKTKARALVRSTDNKVLTIVTDNWNPVQNQEAFEFFNDFVSAGEMRMETAGSLHNGKMVWALAKVNESFELFGGDKVESFLLFSNPHVFGRSIDIRFTPTRAVCNNTVILALGENAKHFVRLNHRSKFNGDQVKGMLGVAKDKLALYKDQAEYLGKKKYRKETLVEYFNRVFPSLTKDEEKTKVLNKVAISRQAEEAMAVIHTQPGSEFAKGSWWQAFNTVTYMTDHLLGRTKDSRLNSAWYGVNRTRKEKALNLAVEYAEAA